LKFGQNSVEFWFKFGRNLVEIWFGSVWFGSVQPFSQPASQQAHQPAHQPAQDVKLVLNKVSCDFVLSSMCDSLQENAKKSVQAL
jgi:hypothetical protein